MKRESLMNFQDLIGAWKAISMNKSKVWRKKRTYISKENIKRISCLSKPTLAAKFFKLNLTQMMSKLEHVSKSTANKLFLTKFHCQGRTKMESIDVLNSILRSELERPLTISQHGTRSSRESFPRSLNHLPLRAELM